MDRHFKAYRLVDGRFAVASLNKGGDVLGADGERRTWASLRAAEKVEMKLETEARAQEVA